MEIKNAERVQKLKETLSSLGKENNLCLIYDIDADGMSSGVLIKHAFEKLGIGFRLELTDVTRRGVLSEENQRKILDTGIDYIITSDVAFVALGLFSAKQALSNKGVRFIAFDHHEYDDSMQSNDFLLIHPIDIFGESHSTMCTSKLVYDILAKFVPLDEFEWVKAIGMIGDFNFIGYGGELQAIIAKYEGKKPELKSTQEYYYDTTRIGKVTRLINYAMAFGDTSVIRDTFRAYSDSETLEDLEKKLEATDINAIREQVDYYSANFERLSERIEDLYFLEIRSKYNISSLVSTILSQIKPNNTFVVYEKLKNGRYKISARRHDRGYNMRDLLSVSVEGMRDANGGGHIPSAGASVRIEDWETFKQNVTKNHEKVKVN